MNTRRIRCALVATVLTPVLLAACGGESPTGPEPGPDPPPPADPPARAATGFGTSSLPGGGPIAFVPEEAPATIYLVSADGGTPERLRAGIYPDWTPDASRMVFDDRATLFEEWGRVWVANGDGTSAQVVSPGARRPTLSPDGARVAYETFRCPPGLSCTRNSVEVARADGTVLGSWRGSSPAWSPTGDRIAYLTDIDAQSGAYVDRGIYVIDADGTGQRFVAAGADPRWSPDGSMIAFSRSDGVLDCGRPQDAGEDPDIFVVAAAGGAPVNLTPDRPCIDHSPAWSPDGSMIAFSSTTVPTDDLEAQQTGLYVMSPDGTGVRKVLDGFSPSNPLEHPTSTSVRWPAPITPAPTASFTTTPTGTPGEYQLAFDGTDPLGQGLAYDWDFGDGQTGAGSAVTHAYDTPGVYTVRLTVTDVRGRRSSVSNPVAVEAPALSVALTLPGHETGPLPLDEPFTVHIEVGASADGLGDLSDVTFNPTSGLDFPDLLAWSAVPEIPAPFTLRPGETRAFDRELIATGPGPATLASTVNATDAAGDRVSAEARRQVRLGGPDFAVTMTLDPARVSLEEDEAGPVPQEVTLTVTVTNTTDDPIEDVTLDVATASRDEDPVGGRVEILESFPISLGTLEPGIDNPLPLTVIATDAGAFRFEALVLGVAPATGATMRGTAQVDLDVTPGGTELRVTYTDSEGTVWVLSDDPRFPLKVPPGRPVHYEGSGWDPAGDPIEVWLEDELVRTHAPSETFEGEITVLYGESRPDDPVRCLAVAEVRQGTTTRYAGFQTHPAEEIVLAVGAEVVAGGEVVRPAAAGTVLCAGEEIVWSGDPTNWAAALASIEGGWVTGDEALVPYYARRVGPPLDGALVPYFGVRIVGSARGKTIEIGAWDLDPCDHPRCIGHWDDPPPPTAAGVLGPVVLDLGGRGVVAIEGVPAPSPPDAWDVQGGAGVLNLYEDAYSDQRFETAYAAREPTTTFTGATELLNGYLFSRGAFVFAGPTSGRGTVVGGRVIFEDAVSLKPTGASVVSFDGTFFVPPGASGNTILGSPARAGEDRLDVLDTEGFEPGDLIAIDEGGPNEETATVTGFGSLLLAAPLRFDHGIGESVVWIGESVVPVRLQDRLEALRATLSSLVPGADEHAAKRLSKAADAIRKALEPELWADPDHLGPKKGKKAFDGMRKAAHELLKLLNKATEEDDPDDGKYDLDAATIADLEDALDEALAIARDLATTAVSGVDCAGDRKCEKELEKARRHLDRAEADAAEGRADKAIKELGKAWEKAGKAARKAG